MNSKKILHIHATCPYFEVHEHTDEKKAEVRLKHIKSHFEWYQKHYGLRQPGARLKVNIVTVNPTLFL